MGANKFATFLHRNTHRMTFLLIYTALEWMLIILLLLNAFLSFMISKFASLFGLKPPCIFCSRIGSSSSYHDFLCESHVGEISKLGFCSNHCRLADTGNMCEDCAASKPVETDRNVALLSWMKRSEQGEKDLRCSCCGVPLESGFYSPYLLLKSEPRGKQQKEEGKKEEDLKGEVFLPSRRALMEDASRDILAIRVLKMDDLERILPIELIDSSTLVKSPALEILALAKKQGMEVLRAEVEDNERFPEDEMVAVYEKHSYVLVPTEKPCDDFSTDAKDIEVVELKENQSSEKDGKGNDEANCEISIGSEICDHESHEIVSQPDAMDHHQPLNGFIETAPTDQATEIEPLGQNSCPVKHLKICPVLNEIEEERLIPETPSTPNYIDCFHGLHKRFLLERREYGTESLDGSIASDIDSMEPPTIDRLKTALKSKINALIALYAELEEERSASAVAANQTMAMITRLQEEKAAMQMEALHYQRMMEEQSEYDQEALQLLNDLMMKREKEKQELEEELEVYQHKVRVYEAMERRKMAKGSRSGSSSSAEESDDISIAPHEDKESNLISMEYDDAVKHLITLDESLAEFEEERLSIIEQLKALEEKLFTMDDEDVCSNSKHMNHIGFENSHGMNGDCKLSQNDSNGYSYCLDTNGSPHSKQNRGRIRANRFLPPFDDISLENEDEFCNNHVAVNTNHNKLAIAEEVDHLYERLHALETDREFLKHCLSSLKKGDKGMDLLQEILQHLRDLRTVDLRVRHIDF